jgi:hypothetical protein
MAQRPAADVTRALAGAATDEILVPAEGDRQMVAS